MKIKTAERALMREWMKLNRQRAKLEAQFDEIDMQIALVLKHLKALEDAIKA